MRRSTKRKLNNLGMVAMIVGGVLLAGFALKLILDTSPDAPKHDSTYESKAPVITEEPAPPQPTSASTAITDDDHKVKITAESDGAMRIGFKFTGADEGLKDANQSFSITRTVRGSTALAQVGVQMGPDATYAKCTISVDGKQKSTQRTSGTALVAVCGV